tara:strand:+ start:1949 stop:4327 length:2379 start_codon:yes stop_codon:yes gene_type:complete
MALSPKVSNIDRALIQAPVEDFSFEEDDLQAQQDDFFNGEIEIVEDEDGGIEITTGEDEFVFGEEPENFYDNLAENLKDDSLGEVASYVTSSVEEDTNSRSDWEDTYVKGLDLLGMRYESRTEPFEGATGVIHPLLNEAITQFQASAYKEMLPSGGPVRANIIGVPTPEIEQQAQRVQEYMNYQIMYEMQEYEPEFDQMLYYLGLAGSAFKKVYRDEILDRPVSKFVPAEEVVVPYIATDLQSAERITHVIKISKNELKKLQLSGFYMDMEGESNASSSTSEVKSAYDDIEGRSPTYNDEQFTLYECHCFLDIEEYADKDESGEETGLKLPYIVTVCKDTGDVLSIRRNYLQEDPNKNKIQHFVQYKFTPGLGFYGFGLIHLLGNLSRTATANLRQLIDAGTLANMPAGFKARGLRIADEQNPLSPGEFRDVDVPGGDLKASLMPLPYKEPSATLFQLMGFVVEAAQRFIGTTDMGVGNGGNQEMPVGTTIALLERGSRIVSAVHKRLHGSLKRELKMLGVLFAQDPRPYPYDTGVDGQIKSQDFDGRIDILPISDPNIFSMSQRVVLAQEQLKLAVAAPDMHNLYEAYRRVYEALGVNNIDQMLKPEPQQVPIDPAMENIETSNAANGQGKLQAFPEQDHDSHIAVHLAYMNSKVAQMQPPVMILLEKHIYEHLGLKAKVTVQQQMQGQQVPPEQQEAMVAKMQAQLFTQFQQAQPPAPEQDPLVQIKQQELQLREQEMVSDQQSDQRKLQLDQQRQQQQFQLGQDRINSTEDIAQMRARIAQQKNANTKG